MLCEICHKNPATIHIQELLPGSKKSLHICIECAEKKANIPLQFDGDFDFTEMLYNLTEQLGMMGMFDGADNSELIDDDQVDPEDEITCMNCGWSLSKLRNTGRVGCQQCYHSFSDFIQDELSSMHRGTVHVGKSPGGTVNEAMATMFKIMNLRQELRELIKREEYEKAAAVRDRINSLSLENFEHQVTLES